MMPRLSIIVATSGRDTLPRALRSIADQPLLPGDEVLVVGHTPEIKRTAEEFFGYRFVQFPYSGDYGIAARQHAMPLATGTHLSFLDDDDSYLPGAFTAIREAIQAHPNCPIMFRMITYWGQILWAEPVVQESNHGGQQFVVPNDPERLGQWGKRYAGDYDFIVSTLAQYPQAALVWDTTVIQACRP